LENTALLPDPSLFLYMDVRKEAVLFSQIEGTQPSLDDLVMFELVSKEKDLPLFLKEEPT